jgi:phosphonate ABC transporter permease subunit PhnE
MSLIRARWWLILSVYVLAVAAALNLLSADGGLSMGRQPWKNLSKTMGELSSPSFLNAITDKPLVEFRSDDGTLLRTEDPRKEELQFLAGVARATVVTLAIATVGTALAALAALPFGVLAAQNLPTFGPLRRFAQGLLNVCRSIHTLVFGLFLVGIVGLGPMAGILAIAFHSFGTLGKLLAETIETLDMGPAYAIRSTGASRLQTVAWGILPNLLPAWVSNILYVWEFNIRDSTVLGLVGAGGLGLLLTESLSLFQWGRLATLLILIVGLVWTFDGISRRVRLSLH